MRAQTTRGEQIISVRPLIAHTPGFKGGIKVLTMKTSWKISLLFFVKEKTLYCKLIVI